MISKTITARSFKLGQQLVKIKKKSYFIFLIEDGVDQLVRKLKKKLSYFCRIMLPLQIWAKSANL